MTQEQEKLLIEQAKTDAQAFGGLYDVYYLKIFNYILRRIADVPTAEDITANVFIKALQQIHRFTWRGLPFSAWLYRIASHEIANYFRDKHTRHASLEVLMQVKGFEPVSEIDIEALYAAEQQKIARHQQFIKVQQALLRLPDKYQQVLSLRYFEKKPIAEISLIMGKRPGTIKSLLSRGIKKLREAAAQSL